MMAGLVANRDYNIGDAIYREEAFSKVLSRSFKDSACESCERRQFFLRSCKQCMSVRYCDKECQRKDWKFHKLECKIMSRLPEDSAIVDMVRLLGNIILQIKGKDWKSIKKQVFGKDFSFADINSNSKHILEDRRHKFLMIEMKELVGNFIGTENMPSDEDFIEIFGKVKFNIVSSRSLTFFIGLSKFENECIANTNVCMGEHRVKVWAIKNIRKGRDKLSVSTVRPILLNTSKLRTDEQSICRCTDCSLPYGESVLSKIVDDKKAFSVILESESVLKVAATFPEICSTRWFREQVETTLRKQENVLGSTNELHMKLLYLKCFMIGGPPMFIRPALKKLEEIMRSVFGEYFFELQTVYETLAFVNFNLNEPEEGMRYFNKVNRYQQYATM